MSLFIQPKQKTKSTFEDYLSLADQPRIIEWVDGEIITYDMPTIYHQNFQLFLLTILNLFVKKFQLGKVIGSPYIVRLWEDGPAREPDILFVSNLQIDKLDDLYFFGGPNLVVELISNSSVRHDRVQKFSEYEQAGVKEYWIIDPRPSRHTVDVFSLNSDGEFAEILPKEDRVYSNVLSNFWINRNWVKDIPDEELAFAEIMLSIPELPATQRKLYELMLLEE